MAAPTKELVENKTLRWVKCFFYCSMPFKLCEMGKMSFHLIGTNDFHLGVEAE